MGEFDDGFLGEDAERKDRSRLRRKNLSQDAVLQVLKNKLAQVLDRPGMYVHLPEGCKEFRGLVVGYVDSLAIASSGYAGGFLHEGIPSVDVKKSAAENIEAITKAARMILDSGDADTASLEQPCVHCNKPTREREIRQLDSVPCHRRCRVRPA